MHDSATTISRHLHGREPVKVGFFHLVCLFLLLSVVGLVGETLVSYLVDGRWESRAGYVIGPFSPLYGLGGVLFTVTVGPLRGRGLPLQFLVAALVGGALEYFAGWFFETRYGIVAWSYIDWPLNFHGHTCAAMMIVWAIIGVAWANLGLPIAVRLVELVPESARTPLAITAFAFIMLDSALTLACLDSWFWRMRGYAPGNALQQFCADNFGDSFMRERFETMSMWTDLAHR